MLIFEGSDGGGKEQPVLKTSMYAHFRQRSAGGGGKRTTPLENKHVRSLSRKGQRVTSLKNKYVCLFSREEGGGGGGKEQLVVTWVKP